MSIASAHRPPRRPRPAPKWRDRAVLFGLLALVVVGLLGAAAATGWAETWAQLRKLSLWQFALLLALSLVNYGLRGLRWHLFVRRLGLAVTLPRSFLHFFAGFAMTVTPGRIGELVRLRWLNRETGRPMIALTPLALVDRAADLAATALLLGAALAFSASGIKGGLPVTFVALTAAYIATRPRLLARIITLAYRILGRAPRLFAKARAAARSLTAFAHGGTLAQAGLAGVLGWAAEGAAFWLLLHWMGADVGLATAIAIFIFSAIAGGLTGAPGGLGGAEAAMIALLSLQGVGLDVSIPATAIIRVTTLWFAILIGLALFARAEKTSLEAPHHGLE